MRAALIGVAIFLLVGCAPASPANRYPRRVPGAIPLRFFNLFPLRAVNNDPPMPIALTFDDGPSDYTPQVLDVLQRRNVPATFFEEGVNISGREWMLQRIVAQGDRIGVHSWNHPNLLSFSGDALKFQVEYTRDIVNGYLGNDPVKCMRPPYGNSNNTVFGAETTAGMAEARWDVDPTDWQVPSSQVIADRVVGAAHPGAVVLMHDGGGYRGNTVAALPQIIDRLRAQGYNFVSIC